MRRTTGNACQRLIAFLREEDASIHAQRAVAAYRKQPLSPDAGEGAHLGMLQRAGMHIDGR